MPHSCTTDADPEPVASFALTRNTSTPAHSPSSRPFELAGEIWKRLDIPVVDPDPVPDPVIDPNPIASGARNPPEPVANIPGVDPNEPDIVDPGHAPNEMGNKQIVAIHTFPDDHLDGTIFLELGTDDE